MIDKGDGDYNQKQRQRENLRDVIKYCENRVDCRRKLVLLYFNENFDARLCHATCDNCQSTQKLVTTDRTALSKAVLLLVKSINSRLTLNQLLDIFRGSQAKLYARHQCLPHFGAGKDLSRTEAERLLQHLVVEDVFQEYCVSNALGFVKTYIRVRRRLDF